MKNKKAKDLMVPIAEYATVTENMTLIEALIVLEEAQKNFDQSKYRHRAIIVYNTNGHVVGKVSQMDILKALEPKNEQVSEKKLSARSGLSQNFLASMVEQLELWDIPIDTMIKRSSKLNVKSIMYEPSCAEFIAEDSSIAKCIHSLVIGQHHSLLVASQNEIVGILRLVDIFHEVYGVMKENELLDSAKENELLSRMNEHELLNSTKEISNSMSG